MNLGLISLIALLAAIVIGFVRKANVGILCIGFSMVLGLVYGIKAGDIIKGFSSSLCMQMIGITYLFAIINENGTLELREPSRLSRSFRSSRSRLRYPQV